MPNRSNGLVHGGGMNRDEWTAIAERNGRDLVSQAFCRGANRPPGQAALRRFVGAGRVP